MNETFLRYVKDCPLTESLLISAELNENNDLILVLDNATKYWEAHYRSSQNNKSELSTRWFRKLTFEHIQDIRISGYVGELNFEKLAERIMTSSVCVSSFTSSDNLYELKLSGATLNFRSSDPVVVEERELGVKQVEDRWIYFDLNTLSEVPFEKPFEVRVSTTE